MTPWKAINQPSDECKMRKAMEELGIVKREPQRYQQLFLSPWNVATSPYATHQVDHPTSLGTEVSLAITGMTQGPY